MVEVGIPTQKRYAEKFATNPKFISEVKKDWYGLDLAYVRDHPESLFWRVFLESEPDACDLDYLPMAVVKQQLKHIKTFYQNYDEEIKGFYSPPYFYLTQKQVDNFVNEVTQRLYRIYQALWVSRTSLSNHKSILSKIA